MEFFKGEKIKKARELKNISALELAEKIGKSKSFIHQIEKNRANPSMKTLEDIAKSLDVSVAYFMEDIEANEDVIYYDNPDILQHLPDDLKDFVLKEESIPYLTVGKMLESSDLKKLTPSQMNVLIEWLRDATKEE